VSSQDGNAKIKIHQDVNIYASKLDKKKELKYKIDKNRQVYFVQIEGSSNVNDVQLNHGDACEITKEEYLNIQAISNSHFLFIEMKED